MLWAGLKAHVKIESWRMFAILLCTLNRRMECLHHMDLHVTSAWETCRTALTCLTRAKKHVTVCPIDSPSLGPPDQGPHGLLLPPLLFWWACRIR